MDTTELVPYRWNGNDWTAVAIGSDPNSANEEKGARHITAATLNILAECFPWFVRLAICSEQRFAALLTVLKQLDADVVGLNEVTPVALQLILSSPFVRDNYYASDNPHISNLSIPGKHGCLLLSRLPFKSLTLLHCPAKPHYRPAVCGVVNHQHDIAFCSLHTMAYQTEKTRRDRAFQIQSTMAAAKKVCASVVVMGDLNMHELGEDALLIQDTDKILDLWTETHCDAKGQEDDGFTFDPSTNSMINRYIPGEARRMRLDRMLLSAGSLFKPAGPVQIWGDQPVDAPREVFLSDHFGLKVDLAPSTAFFGSEQAGAVVRANSKLPLQTHSALSLQFGWALFKHMFWLGDRAFFDKG